MAPRRNTKRTSSATASSSKTPIQPWKCANRACNTGMTRMARDGPGGVGRKVVSDFFGRNKKETKSIHPEVWHWSCRQDYQRGVYADKVVSTQMLNAYYIEYTKNTLIRLRIWRPEATFNVQLQAPAKARLQNYYDILRRNGGDEDDAERQIAVAPEKDKKGKDKPLSLPDAVKPAHAAYIDDHLTANDKGYGYIFDTIMPWIEREVESGAMEKMPPIEFLISAPNDDEVTTDPVTNYDRWVAHCDGVSFVDPSPATEDAPSKKRKLTLKLTPPESRREKRVQLTLRASPPPKIKLELSRGKRVPHAVVSPPTPPAQTDEEVAGQLLSLAQRGNVTPSKKTPSGDLPLYVPPAPGKPAPEVKKPIMARGMVYASGSSSSSLSP